MKKIFIYILLLMVLIVPFKVYAIVERSEYVFLTDQSNILSEDTSNYIVTISDFLYKEAKIDYNVVIVDDLEGLDPSIYCETVFDEYNLGKKGLLVLVDTSDYVIRVQMGGEISRYFTEETITEFIDTYFAPYIEHDDWDKGIKNGYNAFLKVISDAYHLDASEVIVEEDVDFITKYGDIILGFFMLAVVFVSKLEVDLYKRMFNTKHYKDNPLDYVVFGCLLAIDLFILVLTYLVKDYVVILMLIAQFIIIYTLYNNKEIYNIEKENVKVKKTKFKKRKSVRNKRIKKKDK